MGFNYVGFLEGVASVNGGVDVKPKTVKGHLEGSFITKARVIENDQLVFDVESSKGTYLIYGERVKKYAQAVYENILA